MNAAPRPRFAILSTASFRLKDYGSLAQQLDALDIRWDLVGGQRRLRVGLGEAPVGDAERKWVIFQLGIGRGWVRLAAC